MKPQVLKCAKAENHNSSNTRQVSYREVLEGGSTPKMGKGPIFMSSATKTLTMFALTALTLLLTLFAGQTVTTFAKNGCDEGDLEKCEEEIEKYEEKYESTSKKLSELSDKKNELDNQIANYTSEANVTQEQINQLQDEIEEMQKTLGEINATLTDKNTQLAQKIAFRNKILRDYYQTGIYTNFEMLLAGFENPIRAYGFQKSINIDSIRIMDILNSEIDTYEQDKAEAEDIKNGLVTSQSNLVALKSQLDNQKAVAAAEAQRVAEDKDEVAEELESLSQKLAELNAKQQEILKAKFGDDYGSIGDYAAPDYELPDPPFSPAFAAFSYGAYTHYEGMSQYGAKGRAEDGKSYKDIIEFYYGADVKEKDDFPDEIRVQGYGEMDFQYYLYGLAEMPSDFPMDALKAQAVAARSYAYAVMQGYPYERDGGICTTQSCQVYSASKAADPPDRWKEAVDETKDRIIDKSTSSTGYGWYSSTTGGYINSVGWDADGSWPDNAYEKKAGSPWFYKAWYTETYSSSSSNCGRPYPWLDEEEMADILNAWVVWKKGSDDNRERISPVTTSCWGGNPYSMGGMKDKADDLDESYEDIYSVDVEIGNNGQTSKVIFDTEEGRVEIDGEEFKTVFNLRAPAYVSIRNRLFDLEMEN